MNAEPISKGRELYRLILGWTIIVAVVGGGSWFSWAMYKANPERRLAGRWMFDENSTLNTGKPGGYQLQFVGRDIDIFDPSGTKIHTFAWTTYRYGSGTGEFPISLMLKATDDEFTDFANVQLSQNESQMRFHIAGNGPSRANDFRRVQ